MVGLIATSPIPVAYELLTAPRSLLWLSQYGRRWQLSSGRGPHDDGWGLAWHQDAAMKLEKRGQHAAADPAFQQVAGAITTDVLIGHARKASPGMPVSDGNAHPFYRDGLVLAHNGDVELPEEYAPAIRNGATDSEMFLDWLAHHWDRTEQGLRAVVEEAARFRHTSLTFIMSDGLRLYAFRQTKPRPEYLEYYSLYVKHTRHKTAVASEPLDDSPEWQPIDNGTLLVLEAGKQKRLAL